jgi:hypothetical protein
MAEYQKWLVWSGLARPRRFRAQHRFSNTLKGRPALLGSSSLLKNILLGRYDSVG